MTATRLLITDGQGTVHSAARIDRLLQHVPLDVPVLLVGPKRASLPHTVARRVEFLRVKGTGALTPVLESHATGVGPLVVVAVDADLAPGWFTAVQELAALHPTCSVSIGAGLPAVLVFPGGPQALAAEMVAFDGLAGVLPDQETGPRATLGAVMIVKDEARVLGTCLAALAGVVDEVVVYDTGSTDDTVAIARAAGATVVEGYWNDHFGDARNRALEHSTTDWVLQIDADEVVRGDVVATRRFLTGFEHHCLDITLQSTTWGGGSRDTFFGPRVFRRGQGEWHGALHETLVVRGSVEPLPRWRQPLPLTVVHSGYEFATVVEKDKYERNITVAREGVRTATDGRWRALAQVQLGRAYTDAGRSAEALTVLEEVRTGEVWREALLQACYPAVDAALLLDDREAARRWIDVLAELGEKPTRLGYLTARLEAASGNVAQALELVRSLEPGVDLVGRHVDMGLVRLLQVRLQAVSGDTAGAWALLASLLGQDGQELPLSTVLELTTACGIDPVSVAAACSLRRLTSSLREALALPADLADTWLTAVVADGRCGREAVVAGCVQARRLALPAMLPWSLTALQWQVGEFCPLRDTMTDEGADVVDRTVAASLLADFQGDAAAAAHLDRTVGELSEEHRAAAEARLGQLLAGVPA